MENNSKISAKELYDLVLDTNKKVTELANLNVKAKGPRISIGVRVALLTVAIGALLALNALFPAVRDFLGLTLTSTTWNWVYLAYGGITLAVAAFAGMGKLMRLLTTAMAFVPLVIGIVTFI